MHFEFHAPRPPAKAESPEVNLPPPGEPSEALRFLEPGALRFRRAGSRLEMHQEGEEEWRTVSLARLFPFSEPEGWIAVLDEEGKEVGILLRVEDLEPESRALVREELQRRYVTPRIRRILSCRDRWDLVEWTVETDRGRVTFLTRRLQERVQQPLPHRLLLTDVEGNRYEVNLEALDPESRRLVEERL